MAGNINQFLKESEDRLPHENPSVNCEQHLESDKMLEAFEIS